MKLPKYIRKNLSVGLVASLLSLGGLSAALKRSAQGSAEGGGRLQMIIHLDETGGGESEGSKFRVELRNAGENDLILNLGMMLANGRKQYLEKVVLTLMDAQGKSRRLVDVRGPWAIGGRVDPLVVPLGVGCTLTVPVNLHNYMYLAGEAKKYDVVLNPGIYSVEARFVGEGVSQGAAAELMPYWIGSLTSNQLRFEVVKPIATRHPS